LHLVAARAEFLGDAEGVSGFVKGVGFGVHGIVVGSAEEFISGFDVGQQGFRETAQVVFFFV
jgi:hypothetical protein